MTEGAIATPYFVNEKNEAWMEERNEWRGLCGRLMVSIHHPGTKTRI